MRKHLMLLSLTLSCGVAMGCSDEPAPGASEPMETTSSGSEMPASSESTEMGSGTTLDSRDPTLADGAQVAAVKPEEDKLEKHAEEHITFPATRAQVIEACAQTTEFSPGEKKWINEHLPEGTYNSSDDLLKALNSD